MRGLRYLRPSPEAKELLQFIQDDLPTLDLDETLAFYRHLLDNSRHTEDRALLACNDRFFLLVVMCHRADAIHPWIFARCREVEADPDGYLDLWARGHYKSTLITFAGTIQDVLCDPETTIGIFSYSRQTASKFLKQIMQELEKNDDLKAAFPDVLWFNPGREAPAWGVNTGLCVKRQSNPKEQTIEAWGLVEGQPTSVHFKILIFDDLIERRNITNPEQIAKATEAWEMADNLGVGDDTVKRYLGTRYLVGDTYQTMIDRKAVKVRIYPATHNGRPDGNPVLWTMKTWQRKMIDQRSTYAAQLLQNPAAGKQAMFEAAWMRPYEIRPTTLNVYIMADPSRGRTSRSDRTAMAVIGIDAQGNKYLLDGARHRMKLSQRWDMLLFLRSKWRDAVGVQMVRVGYERFGQQSDDEYFMEKMRALKDEDDVFAIEELSWPNEGQMSKQDRVQRLQPDFEQGKFHLAPIINHPDLGDCYWKYNAEDQKIDYSPVRGQTNLMRAMDAQGQNYRVPKAIIRKDEDGNIYDLTKALIEEMLLFPFASHDDLVDATSRIYDMQPAPATAFDRIKPADNYFHDA